MLKILAQHDYMKVIKNFGNMVFTVAIYFSFA